MNVGVEDVIECVELVGGVCEIGVKVVGKGEWSVKCKYVRER